MKICDNAIDHSQGTIITVTTQQKHGNVKISIADNGIGIYKKLKTAFGFQDERESILALTKGKVTTDPKNHTGEGIFFSSKAFDYFTIKANGLSYIKNNIEDDWYIESRKKLKDGGTTIIMEISNNSPTELKTIFDFYTNKETFAFNKTHILVKLCKLEEERYISRSQAKRLLLGLEKFQHVILDFKHVATVGQGFVDEVFRVFQNKYPGIKLEYKNTNDDVLFMIKRGLATTTNS